MAKCTPDSQPQLQLALYTYIYIDTSLIPIAHRSQHVIYLTRVINTSLKRGLIGAKSSTIFGDTTCSQLRWVPKLRKGGACKVSGAERTGNMVGEGRGGEISTIKKNGKTNNPKRDARKGGGVKSAGYLSFIFISLQQMVKSSRPSSYKCSFLRASRSGNANRKLRD